MKKVVIKKVAPLLFIILLFVAGTAQAAITLYDKEGTSFSVDGSFNTFYVYSSSDKKYDSDYTGVKLSDRDQSRVKMGFLPNWIGFEFNKQIGELKLGGRSSFWVTINDSDNNLTESGIDTRQFYGTVDGNWGQVLIGKDFTLFNRSNIFQDEILLGYGNVSDTLGLIDGNGVSFGNIGTGYTYPMPSAQITYRTPDIQGFKLAVGIVDPSRTTTDGQEDMPRIEGELTYNYSFENGSVAAWTGFLYQESETNSNEPDEDDVTSKGISYGLKVKYADFTLYGSGFDGSGVGFLLGTGSDYTLDFPLSENGDEVDSNGYLLQASYVYGPVRVVASYGESKYETDDEWKNETTTGAVFYSINDNLTLVAEYNINEISLQNNFEEDIDTVAIGGIISF